VPSSPVKTAERNVLLIEEYDAPDLIYTGAYIFAYPGVLPDHPDGYLQSNCNPLFPSKEPFWLPRVQGRALAEQAMRLRMPASPAPIFRWVPAFTVSKKRRPQNPPAHRGA